MPKLNQLSQSIVDAELIILLQINDDEDEENKQQTDSNRDYQPVCANLIKLKNFIERDYFYFASSNLVVSSLFYV